MSAKIALSAAIIFGAAILPEMSGARRAYQGDIRGFNLFVRKSLVTVTLGGLQEWAGSLAGLSPASQARKIGTAKSLLSFGHRIGYLPFNVGAAALRVLPVKTTLAERILEEADVIRLIALEPNRRNHALLRLGYIAGLRISEISGLRWRDPRRRAGSGQISLWQGGRNPRGGALDPSQIHRIVKAAAARAGLPGAVSAHYLRHAHVSHAFDRGAPAAPGAGDGGASRNPSRCHAVTNPSARQQPCSQAAAPSLLPGAHRDRGAMACPRL